MDKKKWMIKGILGLLSMFALDTGISHADVIPSNPPGYTASIYSNQYDANCNQIAGGSGVYYDITHCWLPKYNDAVYLVYDDTLIVTDIQPLTATGFQDTCTNCNTGISQDVQVEVLPIQIDTAIGLKQGYRLLVADYGGMTRISVNGTHTFNFPLDTDYDQMPDVWERANGLNINANDAGDDSDTNIGSASTVIGDGIAAIDEYRGFMVNGQHIRTNPKVKDLFVHLEKGQCQSTGNNVSSRYSGQTSLLDFYLPNAKAPDNTSIYNNLHKLLNNYQIHFINENEWQSDFLGYDVNNGFSWSSGSAPSPNDRVINKNGYLSSTQKGLRITECVDISYFSPLGEASLGTPNDLDNAIIYTQRIVEEVKTKIGSTAAPKLYYVPYNSDGTVGTSTNLYNNGTSNVYVNLNYLIAKEMQFTIAHEVGHSILLTKTTNCVTAKGKTTCYGNHHPPETGSNLDQNFVVKTGSGSSPTKSVYLPVHYISSDLADFRLKQ